jgi:tripartite-type tricarboxylate transporter receptor subunit TctC
MARSELGLTRRRALVGAGAVASAGLIGVAPGLGQSKFPARKLSVIIPTGQGGGAERLARAFDAVWSKYLGQPFEYEFHAGAAGQVGYTLYVQKRERDGHNLLFGNMGAEMIMYALQKPPYRFPEDYIYFCRTDIDDSCIFVKKDSEFENIQQVVDAAKKQTLNVAVSRIPHPASIGILTLGEQTGGQYTLVPYGGGNPTQVAVLSGEVDIGALPIAGILALSDQFRVLTLFNKTNIFAEETNNAPPINDAVGTKIPELSSSRSWAVHTDWADQNPDDFKKLAETAKQALESDEFKKAYEKTGAPLKSIQYGDRATCTEYAMAMVELAKRYEGALSAEKG